MRRAKNKLVAPVVKWVGGKRQILYQIKKYVPKTFSTYYEPFLGGGAVLFELQPPKAVVNDINSELINIYEVIKDNVEELIEDLKKYKNQEDDFYEIRDWDRDKERYNKLTPVQKASRIIYLNKTCYNGLFRVNNAGEFNTPFGNYKNPNIINEIIRDKGKPVKRQGREAIGPKVLPGTMIAWLSHYYIKCKTCPFLRAGFFYTIKEFNYYFEITRDISTNIAMKLMTPMTLVLSE